MTIAFFSFLRAGNEARNDDEDDDVVEHYDDIDNDDEKNDYDYNEKKWTLKCYDVGKKTLVEERTMMIWRHSDNDNMNEDNKKSWCILPPNFLINYSAFSHDIMAAILVFQNYELEAILVSQTNHLFLCKRFLLLQ